MLRTWGLQRPSGSSSHPSLSRGVHGGAGRIMRNDHVQRCLQGWPGRPAPLAARGYLKGLRWNETYRRPLSHSGHVQVATGGRRVVRCGVGQLRPHRTVRPTDLKSPAVGFSAFLHGGGLAMALAGGQVGRVPPCTQLSAWALPTFPTPVLPSPTVCPCVGLTLSLEVSKIRAEALVWKGSKPPP